MFNVAVIGYGNIGQAAVRAVKDAPDMRLAGIVRRAARGVPGETVAERAEELGPVDVALLCLPSREMPDAAVQYLSRGIRTVDSFDVHSRIGEVRRRLDEAARRAGSTAILSAGWDPGSDSVLRALLTACAPKGITHTNFGPGMSMGHSVTLRAIEGVEDGISMTLPLGESLHRRMAYIRLSPGASLEAVTRAVLADPSFAHDETHVVAVEDVDALRNMAHGVHLTRDGVSSGAHNQRFDFSMRVDNPALTAQVMVSCARAACRMPPGCYTMIEIAPVDLLPGDPAGWVDRLV